jgi:transaldolase
MGTTKTRARETDPGLERVLCELARVDVPRREVRLESAPHLRALRAAGTSHVYADTADAKELGGLLGGPGGGQIEEVDGNTVNQPLAHEVIERYATPAELRRWRDRLRAERADLAVEELVHLCYAVACSRLANEIAGRFAAGRPWEVSLQVHMGLCEDAGAERRMGHHLKAMVPGVLVKVPFTPHRPHCFLVARDLERVGIPVNFTSTFSARQVVAAALLADVTRTNVFLGRLDQGLQADLLGEHACLEAQRSLVTLRGVARVKTQLIVASVREWRTFVDLAGCDVFTAPCDAIRGLMEQGGVAPGDLESRLQSSYLERLGVSDDVLNALGRERVARVYDVEPELVEFLLEYRATEEYRTLRDGDRLAARLHDAGFGDLLYAPGPRDWEEIRASKIPRLDSDLTKRVALDTLFTLHAHADFERHQAEMDQGIRAGLG